MAALSITAANVLKSSSGSQIVGVLAAGVTVTQGQALYQLSAGTYGLADANGIAPANTFAGISLSAGSPGQPVVICPGDTGAFTIGASGMTVGFPIWLSITPGALTQTFADLGSASAIGIIVGNTLSATTATISPSIGGSVA